MNNEPLHIDPCGVYTRSALKESVCDPIGVDVDLFVARLKPRKVFRAAWLGADLLEAWRSAPALGGIPDRSGKGNGSGRRGKRIEKSFSDEELGIEE